jgi:hypothetical protein
MKTTLFIASALSLAILSCAEQHFGSVQQSAETEFVGMVAGTLGITTGWTLLNYGCHCGPDSPDDVIWVDDVDNCCRVHDEAYIAAPKKIADCNCRTQAYAYTVKDKVVTCAAKQVNECATYCCAADKKIVDCIGDAGPLNNKYAKLDRKNACPLAECRVDEDCDAGYYCDRGTCRMYCDPGDFISADVAAACDSPDEETPDAGTPDAGTPDAEPPDAGMPDVGTPDVGTPDAGTPDAGIPDAPQAPADGPITTSPTLTW